MTTTNFPQGSTSYGVPVGGMFTNGQSWFVQPGTGTNGYDGNTGDGPDVPFATLAQVQSIATSNNNDVAYMIASSNTGSGTTDYQSTTLLWAKDMTHLIGINSGARLSQRSRVGSLSTANGANLAPLFTLSANGCLVDGIEFFAGAVGSNPHSALGCMLVSGNRNHIRNCHIAGIGDATLDYAGQYSLKVTGSENFFEDCTIGLDTVPRTAATYEMTLVGTSNAVAATRNIFRRCRIITYANAATMTFLTVPTNGIDRWNLFEDCTFVNMPTGIANGTSITQGFAMPGTGIPDGCVLLSNCTFTGMLASESSASGKLGYFEYATGKMVFTAF